MELFHPADILLPGEGADMAKWAVVACDQFTSQPEYWQKAEAFVGSAPSTLRIILPEVYLGGTDEAQRIADIHAAMQTYANDVLTKKRNGYVYVERTMQSGAVRQGLVGCVDLEAYNYERGANPPIRPSENTVKERIPPRVAVRRGGCLESPHIIMLIDDPDETVIEPVCAAKGGLEQVYDIDLMEDGGLVRGWAVTDAAQVAGINVAIAALGDAGRFERMYGNAEPFTMAVGDGNHSLASAKALWEETKTGLSAAELASHPGRYCLVELENIQSPAIEIEPIHRVVFGADSTDALKAALAFAAENGCDVRVENGPDGLAEKVADLKKAAGVGAEDRQGDVLASQVFQIVYGGGRFTLHLENPKNPLAAGSVEDFLNAYLKDHGGVEVDYVHGDDHVASLVAGGNCFGIILPPFEKGDLFMGVANGGVLPKKTFSMGHATEKRYYIECRRILP